jgi:hypothetical protein
MHRRGHPRIESLRVTGGSTEVEKVAMSNLDSVDYYIIFILPGAETVKGDPSSPLNYSQVLVI